MRILNKRTIRKHDTFDVLKSCLRGMNRRWRPEQDGDVAEEKNPRPVSHANAGILFTPPCWLEQVPYVWMDACIYLFDSI